MPVLGLVGALPVPCLALLEPPRLYYAVEQSMRHRERMSRFKECTQALPGFAEAVQDP